MKTIHRLSGAPAMSVAVTALLPYQGTRVAPGFLLPGFSEFIGSTLLLVFLGFAGFAGLVGFVGL